jgi:hypothetical protein
MLLGRKASAERYADEPSSRKRIVNCSGCRSKRHDTHTHAATDDCISNSGAERSLGDEEEIVYAHHVTQMASDLD